MKVVIIDGGYRKGNTYSLCKLVEKRLQELGEIDFEYVRLKDYPIDFCRSCHQCFLKGELVCPDHQVISVIQKKLEESDGAIFLSPVYAMNVSALMKNFLDHTSFNYHRPRFYGKKAMVISTTAGAGARKVAKYLEDVLTFWGYSSVVTFPHAIKDIKLRENDKLHRQVEKHARAFYEQLTRKAPKNPTLKQLTYFQLWKNAARYGNPDEADHAYWKDNGFLDGRLYFNPQLPVFKKILSGVLKAMFSVFMRQSESKNT